MKYYMKVKLLECQVQVIEEVTGLPFVPSLICVDCYGRHFRKDGKETVCLACNSPFPPVEVSRLCQ